MERTRPDIAGKCPPDFKVCGSSTSSPSELTCVPKTNEEDPTFGTMCPITGIKIGKSGAPAKSKEHSLGNGYKLWATDQTPMDTPIVEAKVSQGDPCLESKQQAVTKGRYVYPLVKVNYTTYYYQGCSSSIEEEYFTDSRYDKID